MQAGEKKVSTCKEQLLQASLEQDVKFWMMVEGL